MTVEPGAFLLHGVAAFDAVNTVGHFNPFQNGAVRSPIEKYCHPGRIQGEHRIPQRCFRPSRL
jgi:hypothetical protein